jgi:hypothetical protein
MPINNAIMAITTNSSINVKPVRSAARNSCTYDHHILFVSENQKKCHPFCKAERFIKKPLLCGGERLNKAGA